MATPMKKEPSPGPGDYEVNVSEPNVSVSRNPSAWARQKHHSYLARDAGVPSTAFTPSPADYFPPSSIGTGTGPVSSFRSGTRRFFDASTDKALKEGAQQPLDIPSTLSKTGGATAAFRSSTTRSLVARPSTTAIAPRTKLPAGSEFLPRQGPSRRKRAVGAARSSALETRQATMRAASLRKKLHSVPTVPVTRRPPQNIPPPKIPTDFDVPVTSGPSSAFRSTTTRFTGAREAEERPGPGSYTIPDFLASGPRSHHLRGVGGWV